MRDNKPGRGMIAICSANSVGLITEDEPKEIIYENGEKGYAYTGIHLTDNTSKIGHMWSSRDPVIIGSIDKTVCAMLIGFLTHTPDAQKKKVMDTLSYFRDKLNT